MTFRKNHQMFRLAVSFILLAAILSGCGSTAPADVASAVKETQLETMPAVQAATEPAPQLRKGLQTILVMGLDDYERPEGQKGYLNKMQADFILVVVVDEANGKMEALHVNRDTMTDVCRLGVFGDSAGTIYGQIALCHTYGSGGSDSCINAVKTVSRFLGGIKIDHYMTFTMESVEIINDMVGGVTVTVEDDFSKVDPDLVQGQEITLQGKQALTYVRGRRNVGEQTNISRMVRQRQYMNALYGKVLDRITTDENFIKNLTLKLADAFTTDCSVSQLDALSQVMAKCTMEPFVTIDGEAKIGKEFMEFYADPDSLQKAINHLFYE